MQKNALIYNLLHLIFPKVCASCGSKLLEGEHIICTECRIELPITYDWRLKGNPLELLLDSEYGVEFAASFLEYNSSGKVSNIIKEFKFRDAKSIARDMGEWFAATLEGDGISFADIDYIVPVPLHHKRALWRGYNQSQLLSEGVAKVFKLPIKSGVVKRIKHIEPQSKSESRKVRITKVEGIFSVVKPQELESKHILIVDDVSTTGSTLFEIIKSIKTTVPSSKVSVITLSRTVKVV